MDKADETVTLILEGLRKGWKREDYEFINFGDSVRFITNNSAMIRFILETAKSAKVECNMVRDKDRETGEPYHLLDIEGTTEYS